MPEFLDKKEKYKGHEYKIYIFSFFNQNDIFGMKVLVGRKYMFIKIKTFLHFVEISTHTHL